MITLAKGDLVVRHDSGSFVGKRYVVIRRIGAGSFGSVDLLRDRQTGAERVCKTVPIKGMKFEVLSQMKKEIMLLQELDHPRIVRMYEYTEDVAKGVFQLILEYLAGGPCDTLLSGGRRPSESVVSNIMQQVLSAVAYCHARGIVHCDLKPENVLLTSAAPSAHPRRRCLGGLCRWATAPFARLGACEEELVDCKVIDFGLAAHFAPSEPESIAQFAGTPCYIAPEVVGALSGGRFGPKADVWSVGVTAHYLLSSQLPFGREGQAADVLERIRDFAAVDFAAPGCAPPPRRPWSTSGSWSGRRSACGGRRCGVSETSRGLRPS